MKTLWVSCPRVCLCLQVLIGTVCFQLKQTHQPKCTHTVCIREYANTFKWKCMIGGLETVAACWMWVTITSRASRTQLSTPVSRAAERGPGIYTHNYHSLLYGFKRLTVRVCVCVCKPYDGMCICLCVVLGTMSRSIVSASLTSSLIHILVQAFFLFVLTIQRGKHKHTVNCYLSVCVFHTYMNLLVLWSITDRHRLVLLLIHH